MLRVTHMQRSGLCQRQSQRGQVVIITVFLFFLIFAGSLFGLIRTRDPAIEDAAQTQKSLSLAREALIAYASGRASSQRLGELPCPDINNDGLSDTCNTTARQIGRLPTRTLAIADLRDGSGEKLWYAVSNTFRTNSGVTPLNSNTAGQLTVTGIAPAANVVAIVFSPGTAVASQSRTNANINNVAHYLEGENADGNTTFTTAQTSATFNDQLLSITPAMFFPSVEYRAIREARLFLNGYYSTHGYYPLAQSYSGGCSVQGRLPVTPSSCDGGGKSYGNWTNPPPWFWTDSWESVIYYAVAPACSDPTTTSCAGSGGFLTFNGTPSVRAVVAAPGTATGSQTRPCASISDCLEAPNNTSHPAYTYSTGSTASNDRLLMVAP